PDISAADTINWEPELVEAEGRSRLVLRTPWGCTSFAETQAATARGLIEWNSIVYAVVGTTLYGIDVDGVVSNLGTIAGSGQVSMQITSGKLVIAAGVSGGYIYDTSAGLTSITDVQYPDPDTIAFIDQYIIADNGGGGSTWHISALNDPSEWTDPDPGDGTVRSASAESSPDSVVAVFADHEQALIFGSRTIEVWLNTAAGLFTFSRSQGSTITTGISAKFSLQAVDNSVVWLDELGVVRRLADGFAQRISSTAIEQDIQASEFASAYSTQYRRNGHWYYVLHLPNGKTWVYDALLAAQLGHQNAWFRRESKNIAGWRIGHMVRAWGGWYGLDKSAGTLWQMSGSVYAEGSDELTRERISAPYHGNGNWFQVMEVRLEVETGKAAPGLEPVIELATSKSGSFDRMTANYKTRSLGTTGQYRKKISFRRLGRFREAIVSVRVTDAVKSDLLVAEAKVI
ncbi:MAG: packaged DNA stabilization protein, partial [Nevskiales bacterium]